MKNDKKAKIIPLFNSRRSARRNNNNMGEFGASAEETKRFSRLLTMSDELLVNVSHELMTPLNLIYSISGMMEMALTDDSEESRKKLGEINAIQQNCNRLARNFYNMADVTRFNAGELEMNLHDNDIVYIIKNIVEKATEFVESRGLSIRFDSNFEEKVIACDKEKIERALLNLISNSIKFSKTEGSILVSLLDKGKTVEISVTDDGIGIEKKYLANIFDRFSQVDKSLSRKAEGSGLGLSLVKSIALMHGGKVSVNSTIGQGSKFSFEIPAVKCYKPNTLNRVINYFEGSDIVKIEFSDIISKE